MSEGYRCWPKQWYEAAVDCGLATMRPYGCQFSSDEMRDALEKFARAILNGSEAGSRVETPAAGAANCAGADPSGPAPPRSDPEFFGRQWVGDKE